MPYHHLTSNPFFRDTQTYTNQLLNRNIAALQQRGPNHYQIPIEPSQATQPTGNPLAAPAYLANVATSFLPTEENPYQFDKSAPLKGLAQGAQAGSMFGPVGTAVGAVAGAVGGGVVEAIQNRKALKNLNTGVTGTSVDIYGRPLYQGADVSRAMGELSDIQESTPSNIWWDNGPVGIGGLFNRRLKRKKAGELESNISSAQQSYNDAALGYEQNFLARQRYEDMLRQNNIYNLPFNLV